MAEKKNNIKFDIVNKLGVISEGTKGWRKEVNLVSWNGRPAKLDVRDWNEKHEKMGRGITLNRAETRALLDALNQVDLETITDQARADDATE